MESVSLCQSHSVPEDADIYNRLASDLDGYHISMAKPLGGAQGPKLKAKDSVGPIPAQIFH